MSNSELIIKNTIATELRGNQEIPLIVASFAQRRLDATISTKSRESIVQWLVSLFFKNKVSSLSLEAIAKDTWDMLQQHPDRLSFISGVASDLVFSLSTERMQELAKQSAASFTLFSNSRFATPHLKSFERAPEIVASTFKSDPWLLAITILMRVHPELIIGSDAWNRIKNDTNDTGDETGT